ncbi:MAG: MFS transporter [Pseudomonadota bacterium]
MAHPTRIRYGVLALLVLASCVSYVLRYLLSAAAPSLTQEFGLTAEHLSWVFAAFSVGYVVCQFPAGLIADRFGARRAMTIAMLFWGVLTLATAWIPADASVGWVVGLLIVVRCLVGVAHAPLYPVTGATTQRWFPPGQWALPNGLSSAGLTLGSAATAPLLIVLINVMGWRSAFVVLSTMAFVAAALWWLFIRDTPGAHPRVNEQEASLITGERARRDDKRSPSRWRDVLRNRNVLLLTLSYFCMNFVFYQLFNWMFYYLVEIRQIEAQTASYLNALQWIAAAIGATLGAIWCDRLSRRRGMQFGCRAPAVAGLVLSGVLILFGAMAQTPWVMALVLSFAFFCHQGTEGAYWAAAIRAGGPQAGAACGVMNTGGNLVGVLNALLVPWLAGTFGWPVALGSGTVFALTGAALWLAVQLDETPDASRVLESSQRTG